ncbi:hypothetical protein ACFQ08_05230 [Streptosporangium algeriense]|uniref:Uncharacterized protein n=1 Tax=Streptosporangium algeriense TaxID=1682748 RepID=A0ABW3DLV3_9ACTN
MAQQTVEAFGGHDLHIRRRFIWSETGDQGIPDVAAVAVLASLHLTALISPPAHPGQHRHCGGHRTGAPPQPRQRPLGFLPLGDIAADGSTIRLCDHTLRYV